ncbi:hypothetical protein F5876DRAFT_72672 [Lentinula aff. lateritia]|uniref:Uncharacterized protein n=1 Tax=Lentinula aff. lateritia TaxID=2804960 RepID=A0ACC1UCC4_9AGAR|nr:hypothetical protein F5876DRAFT_72672 [Lentinula aff. lateritia]
MELHKRTNDLAGATKKITSGPAGAENTGAKNEIAYRPAGAENTGAENEIAYRPGKSMICYSVLRIGRVKSDKRREWVERWVEHHPDGIYVLLFQDEPFAAEPLTSTQAVGVIEKGKLPTFPFITFGDSKYLDAHFFSSLKAYAPFQTSEDKNSAVHTLRDIDTLQTKCGGAFKNSFDYVDCAVGYFKDNYARSEDKPRLDEKWKVYKDKRDKDLTKAGKRKAVKEDVVDGAKKLKPS